MSYLTRLSQQTGLAAPAQALPPIQSADSSPGMLSEVDDFTTTPEPGQAVEPTVPPVSSSRERNPEPLPPFTESQPPRPDSPGQDSAASALPAIREAFRSGIAPPLPPPTEFSLSPPAPPPSSSEDIYIENQWRTDSQENSFSPPPESATAETPHSSVVLPDRAIARYQNEPLRELQPPAPAVPVDHSPTPPPTYLQTLQAVRAWVSAPPEPEREPPTLEQEVAIGDMDMDMDMERSPAANQSQRQQASTRAAASRSAPFPHTAEPTTTISIGSIEVTVEGPPAPPAPPPPRSPYSPRLSTRLSRHYLRLR